MVNFDLFTEFIFNLCLIIVTATIYKVVINKAII